MDLDGGGRTLLPANPVSSLPFPPLLLPYGTRRERIQDGLRWLDPFPSSLAKLRSDCSLTRLGGISFLGLATFDATPIDDYIAIFLEIFLNLEEHLESVGD
jgi:hypothetical protein